MLGNIGNLFVKCMDKSQKAGGIGLLCNVCISRGHSQFCGTPAKVTNGSI